VIGLDILAIILSRILGLDRIVFLLFFSLGLACHAEEYHLLLPQLLDSLTCENSSNQALIDFGCVLFVLLLGWSHHFPVMHAFPNIVRFHGTCDLLKRIKVTTTTLATSLILLDETNGCGYLKVEIERVNRDF